MKVVLELQDQPSNIKKVTVRHDIVIGRGADCNLRLSAPQISRRHCFLRVSEESAYISDLDSSNGTWLNGKRLTSGKRYELEDGALLAVGPIRFVARVHSEVLATDMLEVRIQDDRIEAELMAPEEAFDATIAAPGEDESDLNFSLESGGPAAEEDEPTADYVSSPVEVAPIDPDGSASEELMAAIPGKEPATAPADDLDVFEPVLIEEVQIIEDVEVVDAEVLDAVEDVEVLADVEVIEDVGMVDAADEALVIEEVDVVEPVDDESEPETVNIDDDNMENELRDFLKGLD